MKIAQVFYGYGGGGAPNVALTLVEQFRKQGYDVDVILLNKPYDNVIHKKCDLKLKRLGVNQVFLNRKPGTYGIKAFYTLIKVLKKNKYDVVHSHLLIPDLLVALVQKIFSYKFNHVVTVHNTVRYHPIILTKVLFNKTTFVRCSPAINELGAKQKEFVVSNAIDFGLYKPKEVLKDQRLKRELGFEDNAILIISVGNLRPQKNHKAGLDMIRELKVNHGYDNIHYLICGTGPEELTLKKYGYKLEVDKNIHFLGLRDDISELLQNADVFLNFSRWEGLPLAVIEAFVSGIPTILSPINEHKIISQRIFQSFISSDFNGKTFALLVKEIIKNQQYPHHEIFKRRSEFLTSYTLESNRKSYELVYQSK